MTNAERFTILIAVLIIILFPAAVLLMIGLVDILTDITTELIRIVRDWLIS